MPDLNDGESVEMQGSASRPYVLKNVGGVYSCSCPAWRNQSFGIERRTCKHLCLLRGDAAETERLGGVLPIKRSEAAYGEVSGYAQFLSRQGNFYHAPDWFVAGLPNVPLDGELWLGRRMFQRAVSIVRRHDQSDLWRQISYRAGSATGKELERLRPRDRIAETSRSN